MLKKNSSIKMILCLVMVTFVIFNSCISVFAATAIEDQYSAAGSLATATQIISENNINLYKIYYPSTLTGTNSYPIVVWGNGTGGQPSDYDSILMQLASWGFVVIDNYDDTTGDGSTIMDSARYIIAQNSNSSSIFYQKLDINKVAAVGHSQGACGVINAATAFSDSSIIKAVATVSLPQYIEGVVPYYNATLLQVPTYFFAGTLFLDAFIIAPLSSMTATYNSLPQGVASAMGRCTNTDHNEIINARGGKVGGYLNAWLRYQLMNDTTAAGAFKGTNPEIKTNSRWENVATKNMP